MNNSEKLYNVHRDPHDVLHATRIIQCVASTCSRTIVEYGEETPESRHINGINAETMHLAKALRRPVPIVERACDHHGGIDYSQSKMQTTPQEERA